VTPSRQAACARAQPSQVFPTPQGPVMIRLRLSVIHLPLSRLWSETLSAIGPRTMVERLVEAAPCAVIDIFRAGTHMAQPGGAHACLEALGFSACDLTVDQQAKPFGVAEVSSTVLRLQFEEGFGHTIEPQGLQVIEGWMGKHDVSFQWK
jgi:hypothetical protein